MCVGGQGAPAELLPVCRVVRCFVGVVVCACRVAAPAELLPVLGGRQGASAELLPVCRAMVFVGVWIEQLGVLDGEGFDLCAGV